MKPTPLAIAEQILNGHVQESTAALDILSSLQGKSLAIDVEGPGITLVLTVDEDRVRVELASEAPATATVRGRPLALLAAVRGDALSGFTDSGLALTGDAEVADDFSTLLRLARPDLEEQLAHVVGDVLAHQAGNAVRNVHAWNRKALAALGLNTTEFLQEESRQLPARVEVEGFFAEIERLRDDAERVAARIDRHIGAAAKG
ncbi:MAG: SCP2 sterol-binding domain-containing protein [Gammaproteobacteria bacterium]